MHVTWQVSSVWATASSTLGTYRTKHQQEPSTVSRTQSCCRYRWAVTVGRRVEPANGRLAIAHRSEHRDRWLTGRNATCVEQSQRRQYDGTAGPQPSGLENRYKCIQAPTTSLSRHTGAVEQCQLAMIIIDPAANAMLGRAVISVRNAWPAQPTSMLVAPGCCCSHSTCKLALLGSRPPRGPQEPGSTACAAPPHISAYCTKMHQANPTPQRPRPFITPLRPAVSRLGPCSRRRPLPAPPSQHPKQAPTRARARPALAPASARAHELAELVVVDAAVAVGVGLLDDVLHVADAQVLDRLRGPGGEGGEGQGVGAGGWGGGGQGQEWMAGLQTERAWQPPPRGHCRCQCRQPAGQPARARPRPPLTASSSSLVMVPLPSVSSSWNAARRCSSRSSLARLSVAARNSW
jgi:hypothetical protein